MNTMKKIATLLICICGMLLSASAQQEYYRADSMIQYKIFAKDTTNKIAFIKTISTYDEKYQITERLAYIWNLKTNKWQISTKNTYSYNGKDVIVDAFSAVPTTGLMRRKGRITYKYFSYPDRLAEIVNEKKADSSEGFQVTSREVFKYINDTLISKDYFVSGKTSYKKFTTTYTYLRDKIEEKRIAYQDASGLAIDSTLTLHLYKNDLVIERDVKFFKEKQANVRNMISYSKKKKIEKIMQKLEKTSATPEKYKYQTKFYYDEDGHLNHKFEFSTDEKGNFQVSPINMYVQYYCSPASPISIRGIGQTVID